MLKILSSPFVGLPSRSKYACQGCSAGGEEKGSRGEKTSAKTVRVQTVCSKA